MIWILRYLGNRQLYTRSTGFTVCVLICLVRLTLLCFNCVLYNFYRLLLDQSYVAWLFCTLACKTNFHILLFCAN